ncbi:MAG TPA: GAF domain-containing protein, partial [Candidatus Limnocylindria bacterium]
MTADSELLQAAVTEVARLLDADGAMIYLVDEASGQLRFAHDAGITDSEARRLIRDLTLPVGTGMFGTAVATGKLTVTDDYPADRRFTHSPVADRIVTAANMRSMAVAPLTSGGRPIGAMGAYSSRPAAFTEAEIALLRALADHAAAAIANQRLMAQLAASEQRYRNLVEGSPDVVWATNASGHFTFLSETVEQLTGRRTDELLGQHWSEIVEPEDRDEFERAWRQSQKEGDPERRARFRVRRRAGPVATVELRGRERLVDGRSAGAHGSMRDITELARLEQSLRAQAEELALRVETQKTLHAIAARITAIRDPDEVLQHVVDAATRLLGSDGAHLTLRDPDRPILRPHVIAGGMDEATRAWLSAQEFPIGGGMNGLAAQHGEPVWTRDYLVDRRIPHTPDDQSVANRMGLRAMAVAPLRAPGGEVFGTLAISYEEPRDISEEQIELLQGLGDIGAIAIANARLYEQVTEAGRRYRFLVDNSPDLIFTADRDGYLTYLSDTCEQLIGWKPEELVGRHFSELIAPEALPVVMEHWQRAQEEPERRQQYRLTLMHRDGTHLPMEINAVGRTVDGEFAGAHGSVRDIRERVALETDLRRQTEELERLLDVQRTLGEIARRIAEVDDPAETLQQVVDASKRLLGSDGAHLTLMDEDGQTLTPMVMAGDTAPETRAWLRTRRFPVGGGINGLAAKTGEPIWTDDYDTDPRIPHDPDDESPSRLELGAVAVAPLRGARGEVIGTLAITYREPRAIDPRDVALLEELAGQGAIAARNAGLYAKLRDSERRYRFLVDHSPDQVFETDADGNLTYLSEASEMLTGRSASELIGQPFLSLVVPEEREALGAIFDRFRTEPLDEQRAEFRVLHRDGHHVAVETVALGRTDDGAFAGIHGATRDISERARLEASLRQQAEELAHSVEAQRTLATLATEISTIRDPGTVLRRTVEAAQRLLQADHAVINQLDTGSDQLYDLAPDDLSLVPESRLSKGAGVAGAAISEVRVRWTGNYLEDEGFVHAAAADDWIREHGFRSQMSAPLIIEDEPMGTLTVHARRANAFGPADAELLGALASHAAIVQNNARLYAEMQQAAEELSRLVEAQRSLSAIATQITSLRDPAVILQRTVDEAYRLLDADLALVNPLSTSRNLLDWAVSHAPADEPLDDVTVVPGQGISGTALAERRVVRTGDYLSDPAIPHVAELDEYIKRRGMRSVMSAPMTTGDEPLGTLTVQSARPHAFSADDAELLGALAAQASVAITNARLLEQLQQSERGYRNLVDHSPDLVWAVDSEGIFTYLGESLERMTGIRPDELLDRHWRHMITEESMAAGAAAWQAIQERPTEDVQLRVELRLAGGGSMAAEVNMVGTVVDGRFAGAQGSIRDIRERERLEQDLRRQAAALAANEERANLARELHDSVTQALFSMGLTARALELLLDRDPEAARQKLTELRELQKDALAEMRTLIFELRPQGLETDGLAQALRNHGAAVQSRTGMSVSVEVDYEERLPIDVEESLYRIAQEALHNVVKHANAEHARIFLGQVGRELRLVVEDDGVGFDPVAVPRGHLGLVGMRQRAERIGGELHIVPRPGGGSRVKARVPIPRVA